MTAKTESLKKLQTALSMEMAAVHQYLLHAHTLDDWGLGQLADKMREEMREELGHASSFINRIFFLKGQPDITAAKKPHHAHSLKEMFEADLADEKNAIQFYTEAAQTATKNSDVGTRTIFEAILLDEEKHMSWLELQIDLLERMGEAAYIAKHMTVENASG